MKERPILFNADMVKAILEGRKTQTRRVMKPQPGLGLDDFERYYHIEVGKYHPALIDKDGELYPGDEIFGAYTDDGEWGCKCPYGQVGDRLWVRETFDYIFGDEGDYLIYKADDYSLAWFNERKKDGSKITWNPSIHMPRWASRINLEITGIRVERLQEISEEDAKNEGVTPHRIDWDDNISPNVTINYREGFIKLWDSINGKMYAWESNPYVWVIEFKRYEQ